MSSFRPIPFALPDLPVVVDLCAVRDDGLVEVDHAPLASRLVRVGRVLGLAGPWTADDLRHTLEGVLRVVLHVRGRDPRGRVLADVVDIEDGEPRLGGEPPCR